MNKREALNHHNTIPVVCAQCGFKTNLTEPTPLMLDILNEISLLRDFQRELTLLQRTKALFACFPNSHHSLKIAKEFLPKDEPRNIELDPEFDAALESDPELKTFLSQSYFWLPARLEFVEQAIEIRIGLNFHMVRCPQCPNGHLSLEPQFYAHLI